MITFDPSIDIRNIGPASYVITRNEKGRIEMYQYTVLKAGAGHCGNVTVIGTARSKQEGLNVIREIIEKSADQYS